jgi:hypothetical protein
MSQTIQDLNPANQIIYSPSNMVKNIRNRIKNLVYQNLALLNINRINCSQCNLPLNSRKYMMQNFIVEHETFKVNTLPIFFRTARNVDQRTAIQWVSEWMNERGFVAILEYIWAR